MLKSITSKLVAVSASAVIASATIASSASALKIPTSKPCQFDSPQITLTSAGQVQGTGFCPNTSAVVEFEDSVSSLGFEGASYAVTEDYPTVSANGTFTVPFVYSRPPGFHVTTWVSITAYDHNDSEYEDNSSNTIIVTVPLPAPVF
jgi:hypothetical protein